MIVTTKYGKTEGYYADGVRRFLGIPFAMPPVGEYAFKHPRKPEPWQGIYEAVSGKANPMQARSYFSDSNFSQDCLYLNIFVPEGLPADAPVMVWIYGGAFASGGTGAYEEGSVDVSYDLSDFAKETKTICVTFNYRLNLYGFLDLSGLDPDFDVNNGIMDQLMALQFVKENIAAFGGDPGNITLFGQSAGGASVLTLMTMPAARDLFQKVILQSPVVDHFFTPEESIKNARKYLKYAGVKEPKELLSLSFEVFEQANQKYSQSFMLKGDIRCAFSPVVDGKIIQNFPKYNLTSNPLPVLIGHTTEEGNMFTPDLPSFLYSLVIPYMKLKADKSISDKKKRMSDAITRSVFIGPIEDIVARYPGDIWQYVYTHVTPEDTRGCCHCAELSVLFNDRNLIGNADHPESKRVGRNMRRIWGEFARTGTCKWEKKGRFIIE